MSKIDWESIKKELPKSSQDLLQKIAGAYQANEDDPVRAVELLLREQMAGLRGRFDALKGGDK